MNIAGKGNNSLNAMPRPIEGHDTSAINYSTSFLQEPKQGRMCGLGPKVSKRMLDPPLVLEIKLDMPQEGAESNLGAAGKTCTLRSTGNNGMNVEERNLKLETQIVCVVTLYDATISKPVVFIYSNGDHPIPVLLGTKVRSPVYMKSIGGDMRLLFVFSDLAIRIQGEYQLQCQVMNLWTGKCEVLLTQRFTIFSPQCFPGVLGMFLV